MPRTIRFIELTLNNFTSIRDLTVKYGDITRMSGQNGEGKTSIGTAPVWILYGVDLLGKTFNPSPSNYEFDRVFASLLFSIDGKQQLLAREIDGKGKNNFYINDSVKTDTQFKAYVAELFDKETFLSLYSPSFFFTQHKDKQRDQLLKYISSSSKKPVLEQLSELQSTKLEEALKKTDIEQLKVDHTNFKNKNDKWHTQSQGSVKTLSEQLTELGKPDQIDREFIGKEIDVLEKKIDSFEADRKKVTDRAEEIRSKQSQVDALTVRIDEGKENYQAAKDALEALQSETIEQSCKACGQELTAEGKAQAEETRSKQEEQKKAAVKAQAEKVNPLIQQRKALREELANLKPLPEPEHTVTDLIEQRNVLEAKIKTDADHKALETKLAEAKKNEADYLKAKNDSIFILDAIKAFKAKEAEIQTEKVQSLFTTLSIRLFKYVKTNDEYVSDFMIQMDGKDYVQLSAGEKIAAGLELTEVLFKQSELIVPCFIDGIESYTGKVSVYDQLITGTAVKGQKLQINGQEVA